MWLAVWSGGAVQAQSDDVRAVIDDQIAAFQAEDLDRAFAHASPSIQGIFGTADRFGQMVRQGYPMVWRPDRLRYLDLRQEGEAWWQRVSIRDVQGAVHVLDYQMIQTPQGWKINAVYLLPPQGATC